MIRTQREKPSSSRLPGNYRGIEDVRDHGLTGKYVNQGYAQTAFQGQVLESEGFVDCSALIIQSVETRQSYMAHIIKHGLTDQQSELLSELPAGRYVAKVVTGQRSRENGASLLPVLNNIVDERQLSIKIRMQPDTQVDSDRFGVSFNPADRSAKLVKREKGEVSKVSFKTD